MKSNKTISKQEAQNYIDSFLQGFLIGEELVLELTDAVGAIGQHNVMVLSATT